MKKKKKNQNNLETDNKNKNIKVKLDFTNCIFFSKKPKKIEEKEK